MDEPRPSPPADPAGTTTVLVEADVVDVLAVPLPRGEAGVISKPNPASESPNQDAAAVIVTPGGPVLLVVADGMGGTRQGGAAAALVVRQLAASLEQVPPGEPLRTSVLNGIEEANRQVVAQVPGSGSTLAAVEVDGSNIRPYHVGDSEILVIGQRGKIKLQSVSHSPAGLGVEAGLLDADEALHHEERHLLLNAVGSTEMRIELGAPLALARHDTLLLASDGLTDNLRLDEIVEIVRRGPLVRAVGRLAALARERMAGASTQPDTPSKPDDVTIVGYRRSA